ncbi:radical SAM protein [archaeon]|nr:radical SAM protein [archaeon]
MQTGTAGIAGIAGIVGIVEQSFSAWRGRSSIILLFAGSLFNRNCWHYSVLERFPLALKHSVKSTAEVLRIVEEQLAGKRASSVVLTGGEPLLQHDLPELCGQLKGMGAEVRLETYGGNPEMLKRLVDGELVDFVSLRVKSVFSRYRELFGYNGDPVKQSFAVLASGGVPFEVCITLVPGLVEEKELKMIAWNLQEAQTLVVEGFDPKKCVEKTLKETLAPLPEMLEQVAASMPFNGRVLIRTGNRETEVKRLESWQANAAI